MAKDIAASASVPESQLVVIKTSSILMNSKRSCAHGSINNNLILSEADMFILETLNFVVDILKVPSVLVGLIALIGLVAQKKSFPTS